MFRLESQMASSVNRWLESSGLKVKKEFVTPWGICDFVGIEFNESRVLDRIRHKQKKAIASITQAAILLQVPEVQSATAITLERLIKKFIAIIPEDIVRANVERLVADRFVVRNSSGRLQKVNGWMPMQNRLVSVELKLSRIEEALKQAKSNLGFAQESFVAFPMAEAQKIFNSQSRWSNYFAEGIGLIGVQSKTCDVLIPPKISNCYGDCTIQLYCVEKFWRSRNAT